MITEGELLYGQPLPTEEILAARLMISRPTVHRAIHDLIASGVLIAHGPRQRVVAGTRPPAVAPVLRGTVLVMTDGALLLQIEEHHAPGWDNFLHMGLHAGLQTHGRHVLVLKLANLQAEEIAHLAAAQPLGLIVLRNAERDPRGADLIARLTAIGIPVVGYGDHLDYPQCDALCSDHRLGSLRLIDVLVAHGRRRPLRCWVVDDLSTDPHLAWLAQRDAGYRAGCQQHDLSEIPAVIWDDIVPTDGDQSARFLRQVRQAAGALASVLLGETPPDALLAISDGQIPVLVAACRLLGREPGTHLDIVGYDHYWSDSLGGGDAKAYVPLATIDKGNHALGEQLAQMLHERISGTVNGPPRHVVVPPTLIDRETLRQMLEARTSMS